MGSPICKKKCRDAIDSGVIRGSMGAERVPPLDGFVTLEVDPDRTEAEDLKAREAWFESKREKESRRWARS